MPTSFPPQIKEDISRKSRLSLDFILEIQSKTIYGYFSFSTRDFVENRKPLITLAFPTAVCCNPTSLGKKQINVTFARYTEVLVKMTKSSQQFHRLL